MNCNSMALNIFPELRKTEIDESVKKDDSVFYNEIIRWIDLTDLRDNNEKNIYITIGGCFDVFPFGVREYWKKR